MAIGKQESELYIFFFQLANDVSQLLTYLQLGLPFTGFYSPLDRRPKVPVKLGGSVPRPPAISPVYSCV